MTSRTAARRLALGTVAALAAASLIAAPAQAAPAFSSAQLETQADVHSDGGPCSTSPGTIQSLNNSEPLAENGPAVSVTHTIAGAVSNGGADTQSGNASVSATGQVTSSGGNVKRVTLSGEGSVSITNTVTPSVCTIHAYAEARLDFGFTVTQPGFMTFTKKVRGAGVYTEVELFTVGGSSGPYQDNYGEQLDVDTTEVVFLPAGTYGGTYYVTGGRSTSLPVSANGRATLVATFQPAGSQTVAAAGKGAKYVSLPATGRSCAANTVTAAVTTKGKRAKTIKQVQVFVNGVKKKTVRKPAAGQAVVVSGIADGSDAAVRVVTKLAKKANGKPRKPAVVTATYAACSPSP